MASHFVVVSPGGIFSCAHPGPTPFNESAQMLLDDGRWDGKDLLVIHTCATQGRPGEFRYQTFRWDTRGTALSALPGGGLYVSTPGGSD